MTHDFAKIKPEPLLERKPAPSPPAWSLMVTGMVVGMAIGVFACVLFYLSGNVPPLNPNASAADIIADSVPQPAADNQPTATPDTGLQLEFYTELAAYEVIVDATPLEITTRESELPAASRSLVATGQTNYFLQTGAFQQLQLANSEMLRQQALGLDVTVKQQALPNRLYYLQSGPYITRAQLDDAEQLLRRHKIPSMRLKPQ